jgi:hypothetical protein
MRTRRANPLIVGQIGLGLSRPLLAGCRSPAELI